MHQKKQYINSKIIDNLCQEVVDGKLSIHSRLNSTTAKTLEAGSFHDALVELFSEKGVITIKELDECKQTVGQRLVQKFRKTVKGSFSKTRNSVSVILSKKWRTTGRAAYSFPGNLLGIVHSDN